MSEPQPITKESFVLAWCEHHRHSYAYCCAPLEAWDELHARDVLKDEIDEDPPS